MSSQVCVLKNVYTSLQKTVSVIGMYDSKNMYISHQKIIAIIDMCLNKNMYFFHKHFLTHKLIDVLKEEYSE